ncbi:rhomboid family intramembrane serine protease [Chitinophaga agrisoli]|uniref:Rhomboid family intramembrane serine protease n=1 Tax=Chitinophaga agrisoli TaxID=2607653 RepID=A0A5B2VP36_9BACT|nr:rhomboid family intramembrane serine protease [Chitinophaga agrisoli]
MIITTSIIVFTCFVSILTFSRPDDKEKLLMWPYMVKQHKEYYRFISSGLVHADYLHLGFNMITLFFFGASMEPRFVDYFGGKTYFLVFYILGLIVSDLPTYIRYRNQYSYRTLGASGAVSAVVFAAILAEPWAQLYVFGIPMPAIVYGLLFLGSSIYMSRRGGDNINHSAHLWGALFGFIFPIILKPVLALQFLDEIKHFERYFAR